MVSNPIHNSKELLVFWEEIYGGLKPVWKRAFLGHYAIQGILSYKSEQIMVAVRRNQKLNDVLKDLHHQAEKKRNSIENKTRFTTLNKGMNHRARLKGER